MKVICRDVALSFVAPKLRQSVHDAFSGSNTPLSKYSGQDDIVVGVPVAGARRS
jgi:hypothetical protein